jgi:hypothetical protein
MVLARLHQGTAKDAIARVANAAPGVLELHVSLWQLEWRGIA